MDPCCKHVNMGVDGGFFSSWVKVGAREYRRLLEKINGGVEPEAVRLLLHSSQSASDVIHGHRFMFLPSSRGDTRGQAWPF